MISEADLVKALHKGAYKATKDYLEWSGGTFLNECAGESYMVASMAQAVMKTSSPPPYLCLEYCLSTLKDDLSQPIIGRLPDHLRGSGRIDMAILNREKQLKFAIEAKCSTAWADNYGNDIERLIHLCRKLRKTSTAGALQACIFIASAYSYSTNGLEKAKKQLDKNISNWETNIFDISTYYQNNYGNIFIEFNVNKNFNIKEISNLTKVSTSFCCIIK